MNRINLIPGLLLISLCILNVPANAGWLDKLKDVMGGDSETAATGGISSLANEDIVAGLKEALARGTESAVTYLGKEDGFLGDQRVRIPMPEKLSAVESGLRKLGQDKYADQFVTSMNRAAEQAVPLASSLFAESVKSMTMSDAKQILQGQDNAATEYFRKSTGEKLHEKFLPVVSSATDSVGVTAKYKNLVDKLGPMGNYMDTSDLDLDQYITGKALDGLFLMVAEEEKKIRENPAARTTDILKKVFGSQ